MERTPAGTSVGVDDPYTHAGRCDHLTSDGRCRYALERADDDPGFAAERRDDGYACVAAEDAVDWRACPHYRATTAGRVCRRCGLAEVRMAHDDARPLLEEHHLSYGSTGDDGGPAHEITVALCRWCHAKIHAGWARIDDDVGPDAEALATREERRSRERTELDFRTAAERDGREGG
jgi:hypothetical protein